MHDIQRHLSIVAARRIHPETIVCSDELSRKFTGFAHDDDAALAKLERQALIASGGGGTLARIALIHGRVGEFEQRRAIRRTFQRLAGPRQHAIHSFGVIAAIHDRMVADLILVARKEQSVPGFVGLITRDLETHVHAETLTQVTRWKAPWSKVGDQKQRTTCFDPVFDGVTLACGKSGTSISISDHRVGDDQNLITGQSLGSERLRSRSNLVTIIGDQVREGLVSAGRGVEVLVRFVEENRGMLVGVGRLSNLDIKIGIGSLSAAPSAPSGPGRPRPLRHPRRGCGACSAALH